VQSHACAQSQAVVRMYKVPMDAFESSESSDEESDGSSGAEEEEKGQRLPSQ